MQNETVAITILGKDKGHLLEVIAKLHLVVEPPLTDLGNAKGTFKTVHSIEFHKEIVGIINNQNHSIHIFLYKRSGADYFWIHREFAEMKKRIQAEKDEKEAMRRRYGKHS